MPKLLLHVCCAPCATSVIERIKAETDYDITIFFSNSNILPAEEYNARVNALKDFIGRVHPEIEIIWDDYVPAEFFAAIKGFENLGEGSARCNSCIGYRLQKTAKKARELGFDVFSTTLTVSPHKNATIINEIGKNLEKEFGVEFLVADFKKRNGYLRSIELCREYNVYRQTYCGCNLDSKE